MVKSLAIDSIPQSGGIVNLMDKRKISEALDSHPYGALVLLDTRLVNWGRDVVFDCVYDPGGPSKAIPFRLLFQDCREMRWKAYAHLAVENDGRQPITPVVDLRLGKDQHRSPAHILTDHFGASLYYGALLLQTASANHTLATSG